MCVWERQIGAHTCGWGNIVCYVMSETSVYVSVILLYVYKPVSTHTHALFFLHVFVFVRKVKGQPTGLRVGFHMTEHLCCLPQGEDQMWVCMYRWGGGLDGLLCLVWSHTGHKHLYSSTPFTQVQVLMSAECCVIVWKHVNTSHAKSNHRRILFFPTTASGAVSW